MKIRTDYVSNSSSSSFVISYDKSLFGDLKKFFENTIIGCETSVQSEKDFFKVYDDSDLDWVQEIKDKVKEAKKEKKSLVYLFLDYEYESLIELLKSINDANGGDKLEILYDGD